LKWSSDGRRIALGDSDGFVSIWNVDKDLFIPKQSDFDMIENLIQNHSAEATQRRNKQGMEERDID
jgi:WD40 repeat protein